MSEKINGRLPTRDHQISNTKKDRTSTSSSSIAAPPNRVSSSLENSSPLDNSSPPSKLRTARSTHSSERKDQAQMSSRVKPNINNEPLDFQTLEQQSNSLLHVGSKFQAEELHENNPAWSSWHANSIHFCPRHSSSADASWAAQDLSPYNRWISKGIPDEGLLFLEGDKESWVECTCKSGLDI